MERETRIFGEGDYWVIEVYRQQEDKEELLFRCAFDHEPSSEEISQVIMQLQQEVGANGSPDFSSVGELV